MIDFSKWTGMVSLEVQCYEDRDNIKVPKKIVEDYVKNYQELDRRTMEDKPWMDAKRPYKEYLKDFCGVDERIGFFTYKAGEYPVILIIKSTQSWNDVKKGQKS